MTIITEEQKAQFDNIMEQVKAIIDALIEAISTFVATAKNGFVAVEAE